MMFCYLDDGDGGDDDDCDDGVWVMLWVFHPEEDEERQ